METKTNSEDAVMSVSRSGRVRKKSSKLLDFQSPDELEKKLLKRQTPSRPAARNVSGHSRPVGRPRLSDSGVQNDLEFDENDMDDDEIVSSDDEMLDEMVADMVEGVEAESMEHEHESKVRQSLYMSEKSNKRKILKDGKIITSKVERKDKGKSRYTAYSLWAREFRKTSKFSKNQDLDFSNASRRLGELWANVSNKEKSAWRRKAKATKAKARDRAIAPAASQSTPTTSSFVNRPTTSRTRKLAERQKTPPPPPSPSPTRKRYSSHRSSTATTTTSSNGGTSFLNSNYLAGTSSTPNSTHKIQLSNIEPIDAAAHLKLLGESLTIIGERLSDHLGPIALSGSLSVLLDSILCSLGPLLCLTQFIPGLEKKPQLKTNLASTLDNIAYVMPGL